MVLEQIATKFPAQLHALEAVEVCALVEIGAAYLVADRPAIALGFGENGRAGGRRERCSSTVMVP